MISYWFMFNFYVLQALTIYLLSVTARSDLSAIYMDPRHITNNYSDFIENEPSDYLEDKQVRYFDDTIVTALSLSIF